MLQHAVEACALLTCLVRLASRMLRGSVSWSTATDAASSESRTVREVANSPSISLDPFANEPGLAAGAARAGLVLLEFRVTFDFDLAVRVLLLARVSGVKLSEFTSLSSSIDTSHCAITLPRSKMTKVSSMISIGASTTSGP